MYSRLVTAVAAAVAAALLYASRRRAVADRELLYCCMCKQRRPSCSFNPKQQRRRSDSLRKCRSCVESYKVTPADAARAAARRAQAEASAMRAVAEAAAVSQCTGGELTAGLDSIEDPLRLARKAETVLRGRTDRISLILENCSDDLNHVAILRTCEALGVYRVFLVEAVTAAGAPGEVAEGKLSAAASRAQRRHAARAAERGFAFDSLLGVRRAQLYAQHLDVHTFKSTAACLAAVRAR